MGKLDIVDSKEYEWDSRTAKQHKLEIIEYLSIKKTSSADGINYMKWLICELIPKINNIKGLANLSNKWFL
jgi:hypothetical protein